MKLHVSNDKKYILTHGAQTLELGPYPQTRSTTDDSGKSKATDPNVVLRELNAFFEQLSDVDKETLFDNYYSYVALTANDHVGVESIRRIQTLTRDMMDVFFNLDRVAEFMETQSIQYPSSVHESYDSDSNRKPRETTYIRSDYFGLACIALVCHAMAPVWTLLGISLSRSAQNDIQARDSTILRTLRSTRFITDSRVNRLYDMVCYLVDNMDEKLKLAIKVDGAGTDCIPQFLLATIMINKLSICSISRAVEKNLIVTVHTSVGTELKKYSNQRSNIRERSDSRMGDDEDKIGFLEAYSTRQKVSDDIFIVNDEYLRDYRNVKTDLDPDIPNELVKICLRSFEKHPPMAIGVVQRTLVQWVLTRAIHIDEDGNRRRLIMPRAIGEIDREAIIPAMAITQAALIYWKYPKIARYISSRAVEKSADDLLELSTPLVDIPADLRELLNRTHPYERPQGSKSASAENMGVISINAFVRLLDDVDWTLECSEELADEVDTDPGIFEVDEYIKHDLARLIAFIAR